MPAARPSRSLTARRSIDHACAQLALDIHQAAPSRQTAYEKDSSASPSALTVELVVLESGRQQLSYDRTGFGSQTAAARLGDAEPYHGWRDVEEATRQRALATLKLISSQTDSLTWPGSRASKARALMEQRERLIAYAAARGHKKEARAMHTANHGD